MIYLHKLLPVVASPIFIVLALMLIGIVTRQKAWVIIGAGVLYALSVPVVSDVLFKQIESHAERLAVRDVPQGDAIVALSAGMGWVKTKDGFVAEWPTPSRFLGGVDLFLAQKAPLLIFTGGKLPWQISEETEGDVLRRYAQLMQIPASQILVTNRVENTEQEANEVKQILAASNTRIILVTSAFHMQRAKKQFEQVGFIVIPYPVDLRVRTNELTLMDFVPDPDALSRTHTAMREMLGRLFYELKGLWVRHFSERHGQISFLAVTAFVFRIPIP